MHFKWKKEAKSVKKAMSLKDELELNDKPFIIKKEWICNQLNEAGIDIKIEYIELYSVVNKELQEMYSKDYLDNYYEQVK